MKKPWLKGIDVRAAFVAPEGYVFVSADFTAMELVCAAAVSGDTVLKRLLAEGKDLHIHTARNVMFEVHADLSDSEFECELGITREVLREMEDDEFKKKFKTWRQDAKIVNFALLYAGTAWTLSKSFGFPMEMAEKMEKGYKAAYPGLSRWMDEVYAVLDRDHQIVYPEFHYVKRMDLPPEWLKFKDPKGYDRQFRAAKRTCLNAMIQGFSAFVVKKALIEIARDFTDESLDAQVLYQIHDEVGVLVAIPDVERAQEIMLDRMRRYVNDVCLDVDPEIKFTMSKGERSKTIAELTAGGPITQASFKSDEELEDEDRLLIFDDEVNLGDIDDPSITSTDFKGVRTMTL